MRHSSLSIGAQPLIGSSVLMSRCRHAPQQHKLALLQARCLSALPPFSVPILLFQILLL